MALKAEFLETTADASVPHDSRRVWELRVSLTHTHLMRPYPTPRLILPALMAMILFLFQTQFDMREFNKPFWLLISCAQATGQNLPNMF